MSQNNIKKARRSVLLFFVIAEGFEPSTACLEGRCSIQLSYATLQSRIGVMKKYWGCHTLSMTSSMLSGWQDSNLRPPRPKRGAITGLRYTPKSLKNCGETGTRTPATVSRRQISNLLHYRSGTSPKFYYKERSRKCGCKCKLSLQRTQQFFRIF